MKYIPILFSLAMLAITATSVLATQPQTSKSVGNLTTATTEQGVAKPSQQLKGACDSNPNLPGC
ncbi:MAG: hypothetical protein Kow00121_03120 [Elainellaceae cyanobacterium]